MAEPSIRIEGLDAVNKLLKSLPVVVRDERLLDDIVAVMINRTRNRFLREVNPGETPWPKSQAALNRVGNRDGGTLFDTGKLFHSIQPFRPGKMKRGIGTDIPYARVHQEGLGAQIQRQYLGISDSDQRILTLLINRRMTDWLDSHREAGE